MIIGRGRMFDNNYLMTKWKGNEGRRKKKIKELRK